MKDLVMIVLLSVIMTLNLLDVLSDMQLGVPTYHIVQESILVALSACGALYISVDLIRRSREMQLLKSKLANADAKDLQYLQSNASRPPGIHPGGTATI